MATTTDVYKLIVETDEALSKVNSFAKGVAAAFTGMVGVVAHFADEITDTADAFNATTAEVLALSAALGAAGGKGDNAVKMFKGINDSIAELNDGNLKTLKNFEDMGLSLGQLGSMSESAIRGQVITNLANMENATERNALAFKMFGKAAIGVDFKKLAQEIQDGKEESEKYAQAIKDAGDAYDSMAKMLKQVKLAFADAFNPVFKILADTKIQTDSIATGFKVIAVAISAILVPLALVRTATIALTTYTAALNAVTAMNPWVRLGMIIVAGITAATTALGLFGDNQKDVNDKTDEQGTITEGNAVKTDELTNKIKQQKEAITKVGDEYNRQTLALKQKLDFERQSLSMSSISSGIVSKINDESISANEKIAQLKYDYSKLDLDTQARVKQSYIDTLDTISKGAAERIKMISTIGEETALIKNNLDIALKMRNEIAAQGKAYQDLIDQNKLALLFGVDRIKAEAEIKNRMAEQAALQTAINESNTLSLPQKIEYLRLLEEGAKNEAEQNRLIELRKGLGEQANERIKAAIGTTKLLGIEQVNAAENANTFEYGWTKAFNSYYEQATNAATMANNAFNSMTSNMNSAIDKFVDTGKFSMSDFATSVIKDLIKIEMKAQAMQLWKMISGGGGAGGGSLFSGLGSLLGFADGGQPPMNKPSIVGENGPELFMPRSAGTVIPNGALGGSGGPQQQITNNTYITNQVSALDAKGVAQLLQENKRMLFGIVESARREMPMGTR